MKAAAAPQQGTSRKGATGLGSVLPLSGRFTGKTAFVFTHTAGGKRTQQSRDLTDIFKTPAVKNSAAQKQLPARQLKKPVSPAHPALLTRAFDGASHEDEQRFYGDLEHVLSALLALENAPHNALRLKPCETDEHARRLLMKMMQPGKAYLSNKFKAQARNVADRKSSRAEIRIRTKRTKRRSRHAALYAAQAVTAPQAPVPSLVPKAPAPAGV